MSDNEEVEFLKDEVERLKSASKRKNHEMRCEALGEDDYAKLAAVKCRVNEMQITDEDHKWLVERLGAYHQWGCYPNELLAELRAEVYRLKLLRKSDRNAFLERAAVIADDHECDNFAGEECNCYFDIAAAIRAEIKP